jgi:16S rRNA (cytidine1402-2'-O)-methyltransferase
VAAEPRDPVAGSKPEPGLYIAATPIGNLGDITLRALDILRRADVVACEDTRVTARLLSRHGIETPRISYHEHNAERALPKILVRLLDGECVVLVSDAGTPLISDPGYRLVRAALEAGHAVIPLPGPSAVMAGLVAAGVPTDRFYYGGFLPPKTGARRRAITTISGLSATLVFFESPRRLAGLLVDLADILGTRDACVARELTKLYEELRRGRLADLREHYAAAAPPRGEVTVIIGPPDKSERPVSSDSEIDALLREALKHQSPSRAAADVAALTGEDRRHIYRRAVALRENG